MWKKFLQALVESLVCINAVCYAYYMAARAEEAPLAPTARDEANDRDLVRMIERLRARTEASA